MAESLERRVQAAAAAALNRNRFVAPIDVLTGLGWLRPQHAEAWRRGRVPYLERVTVASLSKLSRALRILRRWAERSGLQPRETVYVSRTNGRRRLRFTKTGDQNLCRAGVQVARACRTSQRLGRSLGAGSRRPADPVPVTTLHPRTLGR